MRNRVLFLVLLAIGFIDAAAQNKIKKAFKMPANAEYVRGRVFVKIKEEFKDEVAQLAARNAMAVIKDVPLHSIAHLVNPKLNGARIGARAQKPVIDVSKYFALQFDKQQNVEEYINQLYATGYFEIVEPEYKYHSSFTPNDPSIGQQYYLSLIKALQAWDITQGDTSVVIAIVDSGGNLTHSDISPNLFRNWYEIPNNGIDDDGNGFIDDYRGWDFIGTDTLNITKPDSIGDNNPSVKKGGDISHGTWVAGCASAATNNNKGIAGVGYKTKLMFTKHTADNQLTTDGSVLSPYAGMLYAADLFGRHGIRGIINCSFGGSGQSQIIQDLINYIVLDQNCLVVAAAGNSNSSLPSYPAAYDNVLSVAATDQTDVRASFSNYGTTVDISAPGVSIYTTGYNNAYNTVSGTSFSSPITAGAAALVWAKNPSFTAQQVAEQLRVSADASALYTANPNMVGNLGKGRLDIQRALTLELPSIRASDPKLINQNGLAPVPGDKAFLSFDFKNYLKSTSSAIAITISATSSAISISKGKISPGIISEGSTISNKLTPFELTIASGAAPNTLVNLLITYSDGVYSDYQYESFYVNPSFIDVNSNQITTTVSGIGRIGFQDSQDDPRTQGQGFIFNQNSILYEMGLIMGTSTSNLFNNVRGLNNAFDQDFSSTIPIKQIFPGQRSYSEVFGEFTNSTIAIQQTLMIDYRSLVMKDAPYDKFVILEYKVKNSATSALNGFYFGIFSDWDITTNGAQDAADWDNSNKMGYVYPALTAAKPYAGIQLLTGAPAYYAIDNYSNITGNPWGLYNSTTGSFTDANKFQTISATIGSGNERLKAGALTSGGADVSHVVSSGPYNIASGQTITIAFALHAAANFSDLQTSARYADSLYNYTMQASKPLANPDTICYNAPATLNATGANSINWYTTFTGGQSFFNGTQYTTGNLKSDTAFYVSNADHVYESVRTPISVKVKANPKISTSGSTIICQGDTVKLSVALADSTLWNTGQKSNIIKAYAAGKYAVLSKDKTLGCVSKSDTVNVKVNPKPTAAFAVSSDLRTQIPISFTDQSINAVAWFWDFGDGQNSSDQNPVHTYTASSNSVKLTVTAADGCTDTKTNSVAVITAIEESQMHEVRIYPNPVGTQDVQIIIDNDNLNHSRLVMTSSLGQVILDREISTTETHLELSIPSSLLSEGLNILKFNMDGKTVVRKLIKVQ